MQFSYRYRSVEPVNGAKPRVASTSKYDVLASVVGAAVTMLCPAQGHPLPAYRYLQITLYSITEILLRFINFIRT